MNRPDVDTMDELSKRRLLAAIKPTRFEWFLEQFSRFCWWTAGPLEIVGDRADAMRCRLQWRRAKLGRHNAGRTRP